MTKHAAVTRPNATPRIAGAPGANVDRAERLLAVAVVVVAVVVAVVVGRMVGDRVGVARDVGGVRIGAHRRRILADRPRPVGVVGVRLQTAR